MTGLVFLHGWGYGPGTWDGLAGAFGGAPVVVLDAGYFGPPHMQLPEHLADNPDGWVGVGHSLGFALLLGLDIPWRGLVGIGGFLRFCHQPGKDSGTPPDVLDAMIARLDTDPADVLARFHRRCGFKPTPPPIPTPDGLARLRADLLHLRDLDLAPPSRPTPTLFVHAPDDRIVPLDLAREAQALLPGSKLALLHGGGHALPMTRKEDCLRLVREFVHELA